MSNNNTPTTEALKAQYGNLVAPLSPKKESVQIGDGSYTARIYSIVDLGTQENTFDPTKLPTRRLRISFETPTQKHVWSEEKGAQPFALHKEVSFIISREDTTETNLSTLSKIYKRTIGNTGKAEPIFNLLGKMLTITTYTNKNGYASIANYTDVNKDIDITTDRFAPINEPVFFWLPDPSIGELDREMFNSLPEFIQNKIKESPEYKALTSPAKYASEDAIDVDNLPEVDVIAEDALKEAPKMPF